MSLVGRPRLADEIYRQIRDAIIHGRLQAGEALPPSRELALRLGVSRTTVRVAYDRLDGEGLVTSRVGAGTFVSDHLAGRRGPDAPEDGALRGRALWDAVPLPTAFAADARFDFRTGLPDTSLFPYATWRRLLAREFQASASGSHVYGDPAGDPGLREAITRHLGTARGLDVRGDDVVVTNGTQQALDVVARALLAPGDEVAVEDPGYEPARRLLESLGLAVTGVPVDDEGLVVDALPPTARLVCVTPSHQYPLGCVMSPRRRTALLAWARRHDAAIVEDDYDSEYRYGGRPIDPLHTLDTAGRVIYVGSFSKTMLPTLRLGFLVVPAGLHHAVKAAKYVADWHSALPTQRALARFIADGAYGRHIRRMRRVYRARHARVIAGLAGVLSPHLRTVPSAAGLHVAALAPPASVADIDAVAERAAAAGVAVHKVASFCFDQPPRPGLLLGYGAVASTDIDHGLRLLGHAFGAERAASR